MGQKVNPIGLRIGINRLWDSRWFAEKKEFTRKFHQDLLLRKLIMERLKEAGVSRIEIHRSANQVTLNIHTSRPGVVIGSQGANIEDLKTFLEKKFKEKFQINIKEIKKPYLVASILAELIGKQIERRVPYRRACKMALERAMENGAKGVKVHVAGRLNGVEIARSQMFTAGKLPLHTFRSNIDYNLYHAFTTYGAIGVKAWIYKGEIFKKTAHARELVQPEE